MRDRRQQNIIVSPEELRTKDECADEEQQQQFTTQKERVKTCCMTPNVVSNYNMVMSPAELGTKTVLARDRRKLLLCSGQQSESHRQSNMVMGPAGPKIINDCAGEDQQQFI
jgi:hypothetical protein